MNVNDAQYWRNVADQFEAMNQKLNQQIQRVYELHKPVVRNEFAPSKDDMVCAHCETVTENGSTLFVFHPCPTIQALVGESE